MDNPILVHLINRLDNSSDNMKYVGVIESEGPNGETLEITAGVSYEKRMPQSADQIVYISGELTNTGSNVLTLSLYASNRENQSINVKPNEKAIINNIPVSIIYINAIANTTVQYNFSIVDTDNEQEDQAMLLYAKITKTTISNTVNTQKKNLDLPALGVINKDTIVRENFGYYSDDVQTGLSLKGWLWHYLWNYGSRSEPPPTALSNYRNSLVIQGSGAFTQYVACSDTDIAIHDHVHNEARIDEIIFNCHAHFAGGQSNQGRDCQISMGAFFPGIVGNNTVLGFRKFHDTSWQQFWVNTQGNTQIHETGLSSADYEDLSVRIYFKNSENKYVLTLYEYQTGSVFYTNTMTAPLNFYSDNLANSLRPLWWLTNIAGNTSTLEIFDWTLEVN